MIDGSIVGFFKSFRGLRQGDPFSPYLFIVGMESLLVLIEKAVLKGFFSGYKMKNRNDELVKIKHLLFEDDALIFCKDTKKEMVHLSWILLWFEAISRLKINLEKSTIMVVGGVENLEDLS